MSNLREWRLMLSISLRGHHMVLDTFVAMRRGTVALFFILVIIAAVEVAGTFVLAGAAVVLISVDQLSHIC
jgi:hypothetical protein